MHIEGNIYFALGGKHGSCALKPETTAIAIGIAQGITLLVERIRSYRVDQDTDVRCKYRLPHIDTPIVTRTRGRRTTPKRLKSHCRLQQRRIDITISATHHQPLSHIRIEEATMQCIASTSGDATHNIYYRDKGVVLVWHYGALRHILAHILRLWIAIIA